MFFQLFRYSLLVCPFLHSLVSFLRIDFSFLAFHRLGFLWAVSSICIKCLLLVDLSVEKLGAPSMLWYDTRFLLRLFFFFTDEFLHRKFLIHMLINYFIDLFDNIVRQFQLFHGLIIWINRFRLTSYFRRFHLFLLLHFFRWAYLSTQTDFEILSQYIPQVFFNFNLLIHYLH